ncbi:cytochrome C biogenesis protein [Tetzosporium hominis]|uniref:Cytochrome C biogenesis protein n=1 Tax=Tetzosporium hominis TaxID=2020506 RepID=A0A264W725_9BACL|nr:cytochrome c biogenesis protein ResB [Tetzosporium hominis]OZS79355.1 cytochrome C biogenesis protein [Tetzosporium hominis]
MKSLECKCGHINPVGTQLCESCGRPLTEEAINKPLADMRYEGSARRSQTYNKTIIDKIWNFFSSVKVGMWIIVAILVAAAIGTILPQVFYVPANNASEAAAYYERIYGTFGKIYNDLGLSDLYSSWWFQGLIGMLGISLIVASLDRVIPLYKSLKKQKVKRHTSFLQRQRLYTKAENITEDVLTPAEKKLKELKYTVRREDGALLAERGRFSRWGPYVNHLGLIIFLGGVMLRAIPGVYVDEQLWIREGETLAVPGASGYFIQNNGFEFDVYDKDSSNEVFSDAIDRVGTIASNYQTNLTLFEGANQEVVGDPGELEEIKSGPTIVNKPFKFDSYNIYQVDFRLDELKAMTFNLENKESGEQFGEFTIDLIEPEPEYDLGNGYKVELVDYYADFTGFEDGEPQSKSPIPNNPAFLVRMYTPDKPEPETSFVLIRETIEPFGENTHKLKFQAAETRDISGLTVRKDLTLPILMIGGLIFMIGVAQGSYWNHRRIWIQQTETGEVVIAGHTNKNWNSVKKDLYYVTKDTKIPRPVDQQDPEDDLDFEEGDETS